MQAIILNLSHFFLKQSNFYSKFFLDLSGEKWNECINVKGEIFEIMKPIFRHRVSKRTRPFFRCPPVRLSVVAHLVDHTIHHQINMIQ